MIRQCFICNRDFYCPTDTPNPLIANICPYCLAETITDEELVEKVKNGDYS